MMKEYRDAIAEAVDRHLSSGDFWSTEICIPSGELAKWKCVRINPKHFTPAMFLGVWSVDDKYPTTEPIRLLRLMEMPDDSLRLIGRQGPDLFVLTI